MYLKDDTKKIGKSPKLNPQLWIGPCVVIRRYSDLLYEVQLSPKKRTRVLHHDRLKPYPEVELPAWTQQLRDKLKSTQKHLKEARSQDKGIQVDSPQVEEEPEEDGPQEVEPEEEDGPQGVEPEEEDGPQEVEPEEEDGTQEVEPEVEDGSPQKRKRGRPRKRKRKPRPVPPTEEAPAPRRPRRKKEDKKSDPRPPRRSPRTTRPPDRWGYQ